MGLDAVDLLTGGAVGAAMGEALRFAIENVKKGLKFEPTLKRNIETLTSLARLVEEMKGYSKLGQLPVDEIKELETHLQNGEELVRKCSKLSRRSFFRFPHYQGKLQGKDEELKRYLDYNLPVQNKRDFMKIQLVVSKILDILENLVKRDEFGAFNGNQLRVLSGVPDEPYCMGMDVPLRELKIEMLKDDVPVLVLTGLGGSGKTTLAKKLCCLPEIKDKFGTNIFFVCVSKTPDLKSIAQTLLENCKCKVSEFESDEDATNILRVLLRLVGSYPLLLVLDDVSPSLEALVDKFVIEMKNYKILVTSRVAFPRLGTPFPLNPLSPDEALSLFQHYAKPNGRSSYNPSEGLVREIVRGCKGSPLALEVIGGSLCGQPFEVWNDMKERLQNQPFLESVDGTALLYMLQQSLDLLEVKFSVDEKECFIDLGLFPEDHWIPVPILIDMWAELHNLDEDGCKAMNIIHDLTKSNLINLIVNRKVPKDEDMYYDNHFIRLHDLLRDLAIHQNKGDTNQRKRLIIELNRDKHSELWVGQNQQGVIDHIFSFISRMLKPRDAAEILSISTDESVTSSDLCDVQPNEAEVLILNIRSGQYSLPEFTKKMSKLKVLIVTNYGFDRSELNKFELLGFLTNLKRIRLEKVSVPCLCTWVPKNLRKLTLRNCNTKQAFENCSISEAMPNLVEMCIDYCPDLVKLPDDICNIASLKKLSIINCQQVLALPQEIAKLVNLEVIRLCSCSYLEKMPDSVKGLNKLHCLDFSDCVSLSKLPEDIGDLKNLKKLYIDGCSNLNELPYSVTDFENLEHEISVICDEYRAALWKVFPHIPNVKIETPKIEYNLNRSH